MSTTLAPLTPEPGPRPRPRAWHPASPRHLVLHVATGHGVEFIDVTDRVRAFVTAADVRTGLVTIQSLHTTLAVVVNEHEPLLLADFVRQLERWAPSDGSLCARRPGASPGQPHAGRARQRARALPRPGAQRVGVPVCR